VREEEGYVLKIQLARVDEVGGRGDIYGVDVG